MNEHELYLFDRKGYMVVPNALSAEQDKGLHKILDERIASECSDDMRTHRFVPLLDWGKEYRDIIDNPTVVPFMTELLGEDS